MERIAANVVEFPAAAAAAAPWASLIGRVVSVEPGALVVACGADAIEVRCDVLVTADGMRLELGLDDSVLLALVQEGRAETRGVVLGRVEPYGQPRVSTRVIITAGESLELKCGEASVDLRADGKVMVRGEDVLLRAKGTQRIRAGTVSIN